MKVLTFDLGGSSMKSGVVDLEKNCAVSCKRKYILTGVSNATLPEEGEAPLDGITSAETFADAIVRIAKTVDAEIDGLAFSYNCPVNHITGDTFSGGMTQTFLNHQNFPKLFADKCSYPVAVAKDGNCQLLAEVAAGALKGCKSGLALTIGSGIAFGFISDGNVLLGSNNYAGEVSSMLIGSTEESVKNFAVNSGMWGLFTRLADVVGCEPADFNGYTAFDLIREGAPKVLQAFDDYVTGLALEIYNMHCMLDPEAISIGGGISREPLLIEALTKKVAEIDEKYSGRRKNPPVVRQSKFFDDSNLIGAAIAFSRYARKAGQ